MGGPGVVTKKIERGGHRREVRRMRELLLGLGRQHDGANVKILRILGVRERFPVFLFG